MVDDHLTRGRLAALALAGAGFLGGCGGDVVIAPVSPPPAPPRVEAPTPAAAEPSVLSGFPAPAGEPAYKRVVSPRLGLSIPLPDRSGWTLTREKSSFVVFEHTATRSRLQLSMWREDVRMNRERCEERARLLRDLPTRLGATIASRFLDVPEGFDTRVDVGFDATGDEAPLAGWVVAFGGLGRECFALAFTTTALGDDAERIVGDRLAVIQTLTLEGLERRGGVQIGREPSAP